MSKKLFNPFGSDAIENRQIIKGNTTNLINLNNVKYTWATQLFRLMTANFWLPEKIDLTMDVLSYQQLREEERRAYDGILSFLVFLDSLQTANLPNIANVITAPEVSQLVVIQDYQEVIHAQSYAYIIESVIPKDRREAIYEFWKDDQTLFERNEYIAGIYQEYIDCQSDAGLWKVLIANYILEGLYFYNGFAFFYNLANRALCGGTADMIKYINRDELTHCYLFAEIIKEIKKEFPEIADEKVVYELFENAVKQEIQWTNHIVEKVMGITEASTEAYTKHLANRRLRELGYAPLYDGFDKNPYGHLEKIADVEAGASVKGNFFERSVTSYNQPPAKNKKAIASMTFDS
jgi:ribonucleoside-diphosphate reductase beta chain